MIKIIFRNIVFNSAMIFMLGCKLVHPNTLNSNICKIIPCVFFLFIIAQIFMIKELSNAMKSLKLREEFMKRISETEIKKTLLLNNNRFFKYYKSTVCIAYLTLFICNGFVGTFLLFLINQAIKKHALTLLDEFIYVPKQPTKKDMQEFRQKLQEQESLN